MTLNKQGLEAAARAIDPGLSRYLMEDCETIIRAYLAALPAPDGLVERLRADAAQLIRMSKATEFGKDLSVRVKAPDLLIASLTEAATVIQTLQRERDDILGDFSTTAHALEAAEQQVRDMRAGQREAFTLWIRSWAKKRFGVWITHNTAKGAYAEYQESARLLLKEGGE
jgi:hypothetical protein